MIRSKRGNTLMIVLAVIAVMAVLFPILYGSFSQASKRQGDRNKMESYVAFVSSLKRLIEDPMQCPAMLAEDNGPLSVLQLPPNANESTNKKPIAIKWYNQANVLTPVRPGWVSPDGKFKVKSVVLRRTGEPRNRLFQPVRLVKIDGGNRQASDIDVYAIPVRIYIVPAEKDLNVNLADGPVPSGGIIPSVDAPEMYPDMEHKEIQISLLTLVDMNSLQLISCFGLHSVGAACLAHGGSFYSSPTVPPNLRCQPDKICFADSVGIVNSPLSCTSFSGDIAYQPRTVGKDAALNDRYICGLCHNDLLNPPPPPFTPPPGWPAGAKSPLDACSSVAKSPPAAPGTINPGMTGLTCSCPGQYYLSNLACRNTPGIDTCRCSHGQACDLKCVGGVWTEMCVSDPEC